MYSQNAADHDFLTFKYAKLVATVGLAGSALLPVTPIMDGKKGLRGAEVWSGSPTTQPGVIAKGLRMRLTAAA
jgi:hypothetical protein